jgi:hypothetical protein
MKQQAEGHTGCKDDEGADMSELDSSGIRSLCGEGPSVVDHIRKLQLSTGARNKRMRSKGGEGEKGVKRVRGEREPECKG